MFIAYMHGRLHVSMRLEKKYGVTLLFSWILDGIMGGHVKTDTHK